MKIFISGLPFSTLIIVDWCWKNWQMTQIIKKNFFDEEKNERRVALTVRQWWREGRKLLQAIIFIIPSLKSSLTSERERNYLNFKREYTRKGKSAILQLKTNFFLVHNGFYVQGGAPIKYLENRIWKIWIRWISVCWGELKKI